MVRNGVIMKILEKFGCALSERKQSVTGWFGVQGELLPGK